MAVEEDYLNSTVRGMAQYCMIQCERIESPTALDRAQKLHIRAKMSMTFQELKNEIRVFREVLEAELRYKRFAYVPTEKAKLLDGSSKFWDGIPAKFPDCGEDTKEAIFCYALGRNTASVFHSMRVAEHGLRSVARKVGVKLTDKGKPQPVESATWDKVIAGVRNKITAAHALPKTPTRSRKLQFYSDAADSCTYIRDIWRNEVSHSGKPYNDGEALAVLNRVRDFMSLLVVGKK